MLTDLSKIIFSFCLASLLASASALSLNSIATDLLRSILETIYNLFKFNCQKMTFCFKTTYLIQAARIVRVKVNVFLSFQNISFYKFWLIKRFANYKFIYFHSMTFYWSALYHLINFSTVLVNTQIQQAIL